MKLLIKFPSRSRPDKFKYALFQYVTKCKDKENTRFLFTFDEDDVSMANLQEDIQEMCGSMKYTIVYGKSENKIHAINRDMNTDFDILLLASDDMIAEVKGYDDVIREKMKLHYPDTDGVLWFNDGYAEDRLNTLVCMGKKYYERFNFIYNPLYKSFFCDNEFMDVANELKKQTYFPLCIIRHTHPANTSDAREDELYKQNNKYWNEDERTYFHRKKYEYDLSVLICSLAERSEALQKLSTHLHNLKRDNLRVEILTDVDNREKTIGQKRNDLVSRAKGKYCCFIDDDDSVPEYYFSDIEAILTNCKDIDCLSLIGLYYHNGELVKPFLHSLSFKHHCQDKDAFYRPPNHLNPILTGFVKHIGFLKQNHGEDSDFSMRLSKSNLITREAMTTRPLYYYYFVNKK